MSSHTTTATIAGEPQVRARLGGRDTYMPDVVEVARNGLETEARDVIRITVVQGNGTEASAYLTREAAEDLANAILTAADLNPDRPQPPATLAGGAGSIGTLPIGHPRAEQHALRRIERAVTDARIAGAIRPDVLGRIANGLTGARGGYRERLIARTLGNALDAVIDVTEAEAKAIATKAQA